MNSTFVAVIDGTRARFFTLEQPELPEYESGPNLRERECLANTAKEMEGKELWANTKTGRNRGSGGQAHGYDDHRQNHLEEIERSFAKDIANTIVNLTATHQCQQVVLVAEPQILGLVRTTLTPHLPKNLEIKELAKDLSKHKPLEIHSLLAAKNLLPERKIVAGH